ncbi:MAG: hypothetical protein RTU92_04990 [Candidatus Thorarchaeota archaeon]
MCFGRWRKNPAELANKHFNKMILLMIGEPKVWIFDGIAGIDKNDIAGTTPGFLGAIESWAWLRDNTDYLIPALIDMAQDVDGAGFSVLLSRPADHLYSYIRTTHLNTAETQSEIDLGPWDTTGDERYDQSNMCIGGHHSNYLNSDMECQLYPGCMT